MWHRLLLKPQLCFGRFLKWVFVLLSIGDVRSCSFEGRRLVGVVDSDEADGYRITPTVTEFADLLYHVASNTINLLDHRLHQNLNFDTNFDRRESTSGDGVT